MFEDGICEIEKDLYSKTIKISDINYQIARREEQVDIFTRYCELLNYLIAQCTCKYPLSIEG